MTFAIPHPPPLPTHPTGLHFPSKCAWSPLWILPTPPPVVSANIHQPLRNENPRPSRRFLPVRYNGGRAWSQANTKLFTVNFFIILFILEIASIHLSTLEFKKNEINYKPTYTSSSWRGMMTKKIRNFLNLVSHEASIRLLRKNSSG